MNIQAALSDGYTMDEVMAELGKRTGMDYQQAIADGYSKDDVLNELNRRDAGEKPKPTELTDEEQFAAKNPNLYAGLKAAKEVARFGGETAGLVGGGILGAPLGPMGAVAGAGLGYGGVKALERALEGEKATLPEAAQTSLKDVGTGAAMELGGQAVNKVLSGIAWRAKQAKPLMELAKEYGHPFTSAELSTPIHGGQPGRALSTIESVLAWFPGSSGTMQKQYIKELKSLMNVREKLIDNVSQGKGSTKSIEDVGTRINEKLSELLSQKQGLNEQQISAIKNQFLGEMGSSDTAETLGLNAKAIIEKRFAEQVSKKNALYKEIGESIPDADLETPNLMKVAESWLERRKTLPINDSDLMRVLQWGAKRSEFTPEQEVLMAQIDKFPQAVREQMMKKVGIDPESVGSGVKRNWQTLQDMRAEINGLIKKQNEAYTKGNPALTGQTSPQGNIYNELKSALDKDLQEIAKNTGTDALDKLKIANAFYQDEYAPLVKNKDLQRLAYSKPQIIIDTVFRKNAAPEVRMLKGVLGEDAFNQLKGGYINKMTESSIKDGEFSFQKLHNSLAAMDAATLREIFSESELRSLSGYVSAGMKQESLPLLDKTLIKLMGKTDKPQTMVNWVFRPNNAKNIRMIRGAIGNDLFNEAKTYFTEQLFTTNEYGLYRAVPSVKAASKFDDATLQAIYETPQEYKLTQDLLKLSKNSFGAEKMAGNTSRTAPNIITFYEGKALLKDPKSASLTWLTPAALATLYNKASGSLLNMGIKMKAGTPAAAKIASQILSVAGTDAIQESFEQ